MVTSTPLTTTCTSCASSFFLDNGGCVTTCPDGTWKHQLTNVCESCPTGCAACESGVKCTACSPSFVLQQHLCEACAVAHCVDCTGDQQQCVACAAEFFLDPSDNTQCTPCGSGCAECTDQNTCTTCLTGMFRTAQGTCTSCQVANCD